MARTARETRRPWTLKVSTTTWARSSRIIADHPQQPLIGSETASTVSTRGVYETDKIRNWVSAYDLNHTDWSELAEEWWKFYAAREYLPGGFAWTGFDYRGEPTPYGWPSISSQFGIVDMCGFPKDNFFYYKAWWGREPVLHLFPHWNWEQRQGEPVSVWVHSNLEEVELFLNGRSQGRQKVQPLTHVEWQVKYEPGAIEAHGIKDGKVVMTERRETTGAPATIRLSADRSEIAADGEDIALVRVEVLDSAGRALPTADNLIKFRVGGDGTFWVLETAIPTVRNLTNNRCAVSSTAWRSSSFKPRPSRVRSRSKPIQRTSPGRNSQRHEYRSLPGRRCCARQVLRTAVLRTALR